MASIIAAAPQLQVERNEMSSQAFVSRLSRVLAGLLLLGLGDVSFATTAAAVDVEVIHNFSPEPLRAGGGERPRAGVVRDAEGNFYGTTESGGKYGKGTLYVTSAEGATRILHSFRGADGSYPRAELVIRDNVVLYGTTRGSETGAKLKESVVFRFDRESGFKVIHTFDWNTEGGQPSGLLAGSDGYQYGTLAKSYKDGYGALFRISSEGVVDIIHRFSESGIDTPTGTLVQGRDGALYGTSLTYYPRDEPGIVRAGAIYRYSGARVLKVIHKYPVIGDGSASTEGSDPDSGLVIGSDGALYGLTWFGGAHYGGTFFKVKPDGTEYTELFSMPQNFPPGTNALIRGRDGNFYGSTRRGENFAPGQLIRLTPTGGYSVLYEFPAEGGLPKGNSPMGRLVQDPDGRLYGTALAGGSADSGTLFRTVEPVSQVGQ